MSVVHCKREPYDVYIGRGRCPRTGERGRWGNPFRVGRDGTREQVIEKYRVWLHEEVRTGGVDMRELAALEGKALGCWCAPRACHGEVLERAAAWASRALGRASR